MTRYYPQEKKMSSSTKYEGDYMYGFIKYIKLIGDYDKFEEWKPPSMGNATTVEK